MLGNSKSKVFDIWKFRQVGSGSKLHGFVLWEQGGVSRRVRQLGSMEIGESCAPCGKALEGNRSAFLKILQAQEISTVDGSFWVERKLDFELSWRSQVAGVVDVNRRQAAIVPETVIATYPRFPEGNTWTAARKSMLFEQIAEAFCWLRQQNRNPAHGVSHSGFCGCQSTESVPVNRDEGGSWWWRFRRNWFQVRLESGIQGRSCWEVQTWRTIWHESSAEIMSGKSPISLKNVAWVTMDNRQKTNCDASVNESLSCNPDGLKDWQSSSGESCGTDRPA